MKTFLILGAVCLAISAVQGYPKHDPKDDDDYDDLKKTHDDIPEVDVEYHEPHTYYQQLYAQQQLHQLLSQQLAYRQVPHPYFGLAPQAPRWSSAPMVPSAPLVPSAPASGLPGSINFAGTGTADITGNGVGIFGGLGSTQFTGAFPQGVFGIAQGNAEFNGAGSIEVNTMPNGMFGGNFENFAGQAAFNGLGFAGAQGVGNFVGSGIGFGSFTGAGQAEITGEGVTRVVSGSNDFRLERGYDSPAPYASEPVYVPVSSVYEPVYTPAPSHYSPEPAYVPAPAPAPYSPEPTYAPAPAPYVPATYAPAPSPYAPEPAYVPAPYAPEPAYAPTPSHYAPEPAYVPAPAPYVPAPAPYVPAPVPYAPEPIYAPAPSHYVPEPAYAPARVARGLYDAPAYVPAYAPKPTYGPRYGRGLYDALAYVPDYAPAYAPAPAHYAPYAPAHYNPYNPLSTRSY